MLACDAISMAVYASVPIAAWCGVLTVAQLIAVALIAGTATVFFNSAYQVLLPGIVDEADLTEGNAKLMGSQAIAQTGGPGLGGLLGIELVKDRKTKEPAVAERNAFARAAIEAGVVIPDAMGGSSRCLFIAPAVMTRDEIDLCMDVMDRALHTVEEARMSG